MPVPGTRGKAAFRAYGAWGWTARTSEDTVIFKVKVKGGVDESAGAR